MTNRPAEEQQPFYTKASFVLAAVFVAVVVVIGVVLALIGGSDDTVAGEDEATPSPPAATTDNAHQTTPPEDTTAPSSTPTSAAEGDCPSLPGTNGQDALGEGPSVQWHPVGEVAPAFSDDNGPAVREGIKECFAHTATGALLAGYNFLADLRTSALDPAEVVRTRVDAAAPAYDTLLSYATSDRQTTSMSVVAYRFTVADSDQATITFVHQMPGSVDSVYLRDQVTVSWQENDWFVTDVPDPEQIDSVPADFIPWGPEAGNPE